MAIKRQPECSRASLAKQLGLSPALMSGAVTAFLENGWVSERRDGTRVGRGQPALLLRLRAGAIAGIGVSLSTGGIVVSSVDLCGDTLASHSLGTDAQDFKQALPKIEDAMAALLDTAHHIAGITIWAPAMLNTSGDIIDLTPTQRSVDYLAYRQALKERFEYPVHLESKCSAIDEAMHVATPQSVIFALFLDYGVGGGLIERLRVYRGGFGQAVNIGALMPEPQIRPSLPDLARHLGLDPTKPGYDRMLDAQSDKRAEIDDWIQSRGQALSDPLAILTQLLNPTDIVLGGLFPEWILEGLLSQIRLDLYDVAGRAPIAKPTLRVARVVGEQALSVTAASAALYRTLCDPDGVA